MKGASPFLTEFFNHFMTLLWCYFHELGPMPPYGLSGQDTVWAGTFWGVLNVLLCASGAQLELDQTCCVIHHPSSVTDLLRKWSFFVTDTHFLSLTGGPNWPFRCSDFLTVWFKIILCISFLRPVKEMIIFRDRQTSSLTGGSNWMEVISFHDRHFFVTNREFKINF